jgi:CubicO group peptidase (beta-lactamase class C family)
MQRILASSWLRLLCSCVFLVATVASQQTIQQTVSSPRFAPIDAIVQQAIDDHQVPGAVVMVGHNGQVVYRKAFGMRSLEPTREPMTLDTIFDMASLTKPTATAMSVMRLVELGQLRLNDPIAKYIPEFAKNGKEDITVRQLLTHYSGLRPDLDLDTPWQGYDEALRRACEEKPMLPPGARFLYSDINFIVLGELVARVAKMPLNQYAETYIFAPLKMEHTRFLPPQEWLPLIAPTQYEGAEISTPVGRAVTGINGQGRMLRGVVHDPTSRRMGGVAGHAGLFSRADDMAKFAQALLDRKILSPLTIEKMTTPQQPPNATSLRGLGWDIDTPFSSNRGDLLPVGSFGHTGFTGTSMWIDTATQTYIIILANGVHPKGPGGTVTALRTKIATAVVAALDLTPSEKERLRLAEITGYNELLPGMRRVQTRNGSVLTGIDVLAAANFEQLRDKDPSKVRTIGIMTNQSGVDREGRRTIDLLAHAPGIKLAAIFSPEHGVTGTLDTSTIGNTVDKDTGITVYSVYGDSDAKRRPPADVMRKLDAVVIDIQDAGARF